MDTPAPRVSPLVPLPILETTPQGTDLLPAPDTVEAPTDTARPTWHNIGAFVANIVTWPARARLLSTDVVNQQALDTLAPVYRGPRPDPPNLRPRNTNQAHSLPARIGETAMLVAGCGWYLAEALAVAARIHKTPASASNIKVAAANTFVPVRAANTQPASPSLRRLLADSPIAYAPGHYAHGAKQPNSLATILSAFIPEDIPLLPTVSNLPQRIAANVMGVHHADGLPDLVRQHLEDEVVAAVLRNVAAVTVLLRITGAYFPRVITLTNDMPVGRVLEQIQESRSARIYSFTLKDGQIFPFHHPNLRRYS